MNLYAIEFLHAAPKDIEKGLKCFLLAENDEEVYHFIDKEFNAGCWKDSEDDVMPGDEFYVYDDDGVISETLTSFKDFIIRIKGEMNDDNADFSDAYYGITHYGWKLLEENTTRDYSEMILLGIVREI